MLSLLNLNLDDRMQKIIKSECNEMKIRAGKTKLFKHLKIHEIVGELHQRKISFCSEDKKSRLEEK